MNINIIILCCDICFDIILKYYFQILFSNIILKYYFPITHLFHVNFTPFALQGNLS